MILDDEDLQALPALLVENIYEISRANLKKRQEENPNCVPLKNPKVQDDGTPPGIFYSNFYDGRQTLKR